MAQIFKTYLGIFLMFLCLLVLTGIISADIDTSHARSFHADCVNEIEDSRFSGTVLSACTESAVNAGYTGLICKPVLDTDGKMIMMEVVLKYKYTIPFLNLLTDHEIRGFAR